jgi:signal transduction histidine kinase
LETLGFYAQRVPEVTESQGKPSAAPAEQLQRFFHDLATPLSGASLHLERASRLTARGEDPSEALATARRELDRAFDLFEEGRAAILKP